MASLKANITDLESQTSQLASKASQLETSLEDEQAAASRLTEVIAGLRASLKAE